MSDLVLKRVERHRFPNSVGAGFSIGWDTFFQNYEFKAKVRWLSLTVHFLFWHVTFRTPTKMYGIRRSKVNGPSVEFYWKDLHGKAVTLYYSEDKGSGDKNVEQLWAVAPDGTRYLLAEEIK